jgi:hypothetical protein
MGCPPPGRRSEPKTLDVEQVLSVCPSSSFSRRTALQSKRPRTARARVTRRTKRKHSTGAARRAALWKRFARSGALPTEARFAPLSRGFGPWQRGLRSVARNRRCSLDARLPCPRLRESSRAASLTILSLSDNWILTTSRAAPLSAHARREMAAAARPGTPGCPTRLPPARGEIRRQFRRGFAAEERSRQGRAGTRTQAFVDPWARLVRTTPPCNGEEEWPSPSWQHTF